MLNFHRKMIKNYTHDNHKEILVVSIMYVMLGIAYVYFQTMKTSMTCCLSGIQYMALR